jgi:cytochrome P450
MPFGFSVHSCVRKRLALNEMRIVVAKIAREFDVVLWESIKKNCLKASGRIVLREVGALWLKPVPPFPLEYLQWVQG